eukprot:12865073-Ditylum_brightwellii.AAC.1
MLLLGNQKSRNAVSSSPYASHPLISPADLCAKLLASLQCAQCQTRLSVSPIMPGCHNLVCGQNSVLMTPLCPTIGEA